MSSLQDMTCEASTPLSLPNNRRILELNATVPQPMPWRQQKSRPLQQRVLSTRSLLARLLATIIACSRTRKYHTLAMEDASALISTHFVIDNRNLSLESYSSYKRWFAGLRKRGLHCRLNRARIDNPASQRSAGIRRPVAGLTARLDFETLKMPKIV